MDRICSLRWLFDWPVLLLLAACVMSQFVGLAVLVDAMRGSTENEGAAPSKTIGVAAGMGVGLGTGAGIMLETDGGSFGAVAASKVFHLGFSFCALFTYSLLPFFPAGGAGTPLYVAEPGIASWGSPSLARQRGARMP